MMPAVTVAGALALAGCGGGSSTPGTTTTTVNSTTLTIQPGDTSHHAGYNYTCDEDRTAACVITITNGVIQTGAEGVTREAAKAPSGTSQGSLSLAALEIASGDNKGLLNWADQGSNTYDSHAFISEADYGKLTEENRIHRESVKGG